MRKLTLRLLLSIIILVVLLVLGSVLGWWDSLGRAGAAWLWWLLVLLLVGVLIAAVVVGVIALRAFLPRYWERRFLARQHADDTPPDAEAEGYRQLQQKMQEAVQTLAQSPDLRKQRGLPLYAIPWYLCIGASQSGKTTMLQGVATSFAPFAHPPSATVAPTQNCDWWFFNTAIILDTAGHYAFPKNEVEHSRWYRFLRLLRAHRALQPINGLIIALPVDTLASKRQEEVRLEAAELRKRIDEAIRELGVDFPVYLLITRCDMLEGFTEFFECLPAQTLQQVFGYIHEAQPLGDQRQPQSSSPLHFEPIAEGLVERLQQLRLSIFNEERLPPATLRQRIFCFPEEFQALLQPLNIFVETLVAENPLYHLPFLRGLFFSSAQQQGSRHSFLRRQFHFDAPSSSIISGTKTYFLHDFLAVVLPRDRYLVKPTRRAFRSRRLWHLFGFGGCVVLCLLLISLLLWAFMSDRRDYAAVQQESCTTTREGQDSGAHLELSDACRQIVQALIEQNRQRAVWRKLVFNRSGQLEEQLRQRYVEQFTAGVLTELDTSLSQRLRAGSDTIPLVFLLIKRIELLNQCLSRFGCPEAFENDLRPDYQLMLDPGLQPAGSGQQVTQLQYTYEAYLRWASEGPEAVLRRELEAHAERLRHWFAAKQFALQQIVPWANQHYAPVTPQEYWEGIPAADGRKTTQVDGAYTVSAWKQSILPFLQRAEDAVPDMAPLLRAFQEEYSAQYFKQWRDFLVDFPRGEALAREARRRLASKFLDENSPYNRIVDVVFAQLKPLLPVAMILEDTFAGAVGGKPEQPVSWIEKAKRTVSQLWDKGGTVSVTEGIKDAGTVTVAEPAVPHWARVLHHYLRSESRKAYLEALKQMRELLAGAIPTEKSFQLIQVAFQEGKPSDKSPHPVLKAWWILSQFRDKESMNEEDMKVVWPVLERPALLVWKVTLESAGEFLQKSWADNVIAPTKGLAELEQLQRLYGPQGKVREFADQFMKPFLINNESDFGQVLGAKLPLSPALLKALQTEKQLKPVLEEEKYQVQVTAGQTDILNPVVPFDLRTEFLPNCDDKKKVCYPPKDGCDPSATIAWSPKSCGEPRIIFYVSCDRNCVERAELFRIVVSEGTVSLTKRYQGQSGFLSFVREFRGAEKPRNFEVNDFVSSALPEERRQVTEALNKLRIGTIRARFHVDAPSLDKLLSLSSPVVPLTITQ
jgi:type VI secretion system protein ImpL